MLDLKSLDSYYPALGFLVPGLIALFVRSQFVTGRSPPHTAALLPYLTISIIYYALALPVVDFVLSLEESGYRRPLAWFGLVFIGPALFGLVLGIDIQKGFSRRIIQRLGLNPVHVMPTAWDWKFGSSMANQWVLVTLKDGTRFAGFCGEKYSFMSSDPSERDIYIQWIYDIDDESKTWSSRGDTGVLITAGEVSTIEFWPYTPPRRIPMSKTDKSTSQPRPTQVERGYQPAPQGGHQPTGQNAPTTPPTNAPNTGSGGKK